MQWVTRDQRAAIAYEAQLGTLLVEVKRKLKRAFGIKNVLGDRQIEKYYNEFYEGTRISTACGERSGRPRSAVNEENISLIRELMQIRRNWTYCEIAAELGISQASAGRAIKAAGFTWKATRWVPHELTDAQKEARVVAAVHNLQMFRRDARMLGRIISIDETYIQYYTPPDPNKAHEWRLSDEPPPTQATLSLSDRADKVLLVIAVFQDQIVAWDYLEPGQQMVKES